MFECVKVLFQTATKSVHSTMMSRLLFVKTTVCITDVVTDVSGRLALSILMTIDFHQCFIRLRRKLKRWFNM